MFYFTFIDNFVKKIRNLDALQHRLLELPLDLLALVVGVGLAMEGEEGTEIELRLLEDLDLADVDLERDHVSGDEPTREI